MYNVIFLQILTSICEQLFLYQLNWDVHVTFILWFSYRVHYLWYWADEYLQMHSVCYSIISNKCIVYINKKIQNIAHNCEELFILTRGFASFFYYLRNPHWDDVMSKCFQLLHFTAPKHFSSTNFFGFFIHDLRFSRNIFWQ